MTEYLDIWNNCVELVFQMIQYSTILFIGHAQVGKGKSE